MTTSAAKRTSMVPQAVPKRKLSNKRHRASVKSSPSVVIEQWIQSLFVGGNRNEMNVR